jgi:TPR repeat protein
MKTRFFRLRAILALALFVSVVSPQSASAARHKGIDSTLLAKANAGDAEAQYELGNVYNYGDGARQDYAQALLWYRKSAEQGNANSQFQLGGMYHLGHGVPQDDVTAFNWTKKAAEQGHGDAEFYVSTAYDAGWGVPPDHAQGFFWLRRGAEDGNANSQYFLGLGYEHGLPHMAQDYAKAYFWLDLAASESDPKQGKEAATERDVAASHLTQAELASEQERVQEWHKQHPVKSQ